MYNTKIKDITNSEMVVWSKSKGTEELLEPTWMKKIAMGFPLKQEILT